jgi:hypothetical protein
MSIPVVVLGLKIFRILISSENPDPLRAWNVPDNPARLNEAAVMH